MITILNREFQHPADGWYQIEARGEHPNRAAGVVQVIDEQAAASIVTQFNQDATAGKLRHGSELLIDHEHFSDQQDQETRAYGWLQELQNRSDGIYGRIHWSATGKAAVDGGDYRFFSTEYDPEDLTVLNSEKSAGGAATRIRPIRLSGLSLTNMFNNRGQKPITITNRTSDTLTEQNRVKAPAKASASSRVSGVMVFNSIVTALRNRTGLEYSRAFNVVLAANADLLRGSLDATNHTTPLFRLTNRTATATGLRAGASWELTVEKVTRLTNRFFLLLLNAPTSLQWDVLCRTAEGLEECGVARRLFNRANDTQISATDSKSANARAGEALAFLEAQEVKKVDFGATEKFQSWTPKQKWLGFRGQIERLMKDDGLSLQAAFAKLKETQPIFWTQAMLSFEPDKQ